MLKSIYFDIFGYMKVEIWSDIMCPYCYIGKRNFEAALEQIDFKDQIVVIWKSFQLDPTIPASFEVKMNTCEYLAQRKGISLEQSKQLHANVVEMARKVGLEYNFDISIVANSFDAHKLIQLAKSKGLGDEAEEMLFRAYFTEGKDMSDHKVLIELGSSIGLDQAEILVALSNSSYSDLVHADILEAQQIGVRGVPFFVFDRKYAVSGAQPVDIFVNALKQTYTESQDTSSSCTPGGGCC